VQATATAITVGPKKNDPMADGYATAAAKIRSPRTRRKTTKSSCGPPPNPPEVGLRLLRKSTYTTFGLAKLGVP